MNSAIKELLDEVFSSCLGESVTILRITPEPTSDGSLSIFGQLRSAEGARTFLVRVSCSRSVLNAGRGRLRVAVD